jgi:hypothetical protein
MPRYDVDDEDHIDMRPLQRLVIWGGCAVVAVSGVVMAGRTEVGAERAQVALAALQEAPSEIVAHPSNLLAMRSTADDAATRSLAEAVRNLTADRDRLASRVATLEQNLTDLTGSISRAQAPAANGAAQNAAASAAAGTNGPPQAAPRPDDKSEAIPPPAATDTASASNSSTETRSIAPSADQAAIGQTANIPLPRPAPMATLIQSYVNSSSAPAGGSENRLAAVSPDANPVPDAPPNGFAIDLGTATSVNTLRAHWGSVKAAHAAMLEGLRPLVSVRQSTRPGYTEFHLVVGPVADAEAAARLCQALTSARVPCRPSTFDGQRLDLR